MSRVEVIQVDAYTVVSKVIEDEPKAKEPAEDTPEEAPKPRGRPRKTPQE